MIEDTDDMTRYAADAISCNCVSCHGTASLLFLKCRDEILKSL